MDAELFRSRADAGKRLAERLLDYEGEDVVVLAIPRGGVPVGAEVARRLNARLDVIIPRKIPIPWNPEAGFGAITADGTIVLNQRMVKNLGLSKDEIQAIADEVREEIERRTREYRDDRPPTDVKGKTVILVDDGLASGYTMLAAIESVRKHNPVRVIVAVPVASSAAARLVSTRVDGMVALVTSERLPFAVADFYREWRDLTDEETVGYLRDA
ncbi:MAG TPA: phosphoribosyltransferase family protein [Armatimonadota bacterium]|nr:phosphoribosyltransferase family protein [Armatimonadota bacterium]